jgi:hypothetical protein
MNKPHLTLWGIVAKTAAIHTLTYFVTGFIAFTLFNYRERFADPALSAYMRSTDDPLVMAGVLFQPIRGLLFGLVFYLLREVLFRQKNGWLITWALLVVVGILGTFGPAPSSIEGLIYTKLSFNSLWGGLVEVLTQSFLLSAITYYWINRPEKRLLTWVFGVLLVITLIFPVLGLISR